MITLTVKGYNEHIILLFLLILKLILY